MWWGQGGWRVAEFQVWKEHWRWKSSHLVTLVTLGLCSGYFPFCNVLLPALSMAGSFSIFNINSNVFPLREAFPCHFTVPSTGPDSFKETLDADCISLTCFSWAPWELEIAPSLQMRKLIWEWLSISLEVIEPVSRRSKVWTQVCLTANTSCS